MANQEHLKILTQGVRAWNDWRDKNYEVMPDLSGADLFGLEMQGAEFNGVNFSETKLVKADFGDTHYSRGGIILASSFFEEANFHKADLSGANFSAASMAQANFTGALLTDTNFSNAWLKGAKFVGANVSFANLDRAILDGADFSNAVFMFTTIGDVDLSEVIGLNTVLHQAPSAIGIYTIFKELV